MNTLMIKCGLIFIWAALFTMPLRPGLPVQAASSLPGKKKIVVKLTQYEVKPSWQPRLRKQISDLVFSSLRAQGNIMSEAYYENTDSTIIWLIERWSSQQSLEKNLQSREAKALTVSAKEALRNPAKVIDVIDLEPLSNTAWRKTPKSSDQPFTIMLFVDAKEGTQNEFKKLYHEAMPGFRSEPGVVTYQLCQLKKDATKFITYEKFRNDAAFQEHLKVPFVDPVIRYLRSSIKNPPFENGLHKLIEFAPGYRE